MIKFCCRKSDEQETAAVGTEMIQGYTLSPWTLRLRNKLLDQEYSRYQRKEVYERGKILLSVLAVLLFIIFASAINSVE